VAVVASGMVDSVNGGVQDVFQNQRKLENVRGVPLCFPFNLHI